ncbi:antibiotic ABC transporter [Pararhodobacter sp. SW119]|uniref:antibiotic ABC transporter n=1 Tax=Pararhodobacter sp. SW119 TaxID=2780075 RepID=UPI001ADFB190|nr:antibiotic ABC transporter [Pararhodobacter sp. SW119]
MMLTPAAMQLANTYTRMLVESQMIITMRMMGMVGAWRVSPTENKRMVQEKMSAFMKGAAAAGAVAMRGADAVAIVTAATAPYSRATRANTRRLRGGHPLLPK